VPWCHVLAAAVSALGFFVQGASGFGSGLVMMGLLPFVMDAREAAVVVSLMVPLLMIILLVKLRGRVRAAVALPLVLALLVGVRVGVAIFVEVETPVIEIVIGGSLACFSSYQLLSRRELRARGNWAIACVVGFAGGVLVGTSNTGGPPIVLYVYMLGMPKEETSGTLQAVFLAGAAYKVVELVLRGQVTQSHVELGAIYLLAAIPALFSGFALFRRIDTGKLRRAVYAMLVAVGVLLVFSGVRSI
jgi:hypothetical protein